MKTIRIIARILLGMVFIFSGFVKGIDPQGSAIKFSEYFVSFGLPEWKALSLVLSVLLSTAEILIGICLFIGLRMKTTAWAALLFMVFFTILTLYIALANPVTDCGCFGDAIKLSNWATFYKNIVFVGIAIFIFQQRKLYIPAFRPGVEWSLVVLYTILAMGTFVYCYNHLPFIDFRPYHVGADIKAGMVIPEGAPVSEFKTILVYEKNGEKKEFTMENYPWQDSTWKWVESKNILIKQGYQPPIHDFSVTDELGNELTDSILSDRGYSFLLISEKLTEANAKALVQANEIASTALAAGHKFYCLTASPNDDVKKTVSSLNLQYPIFSSDGTALKTVIRANPGLVLIKEGVVLGQWHYRDFPKPAALKGNLLALQLNHQRCNRNMLLSLSFIFAFLVSAAALAAVKGRCKPQEEAL